MLPWLQRHNIIKSLGIISRSTEDRLGRAVAAVDLSVVWRRCVAARTRRQAEVPAVVKVRGAQPPLLRLWRSLAPC